MSSDGERGDNPASLPGGSHDNGINAMVIDDCLIGQSSSLRQISLPVTNSDDYQGAAACSK